MPLRGKEEQTKANQNAPKCVEINPDRINFLNSRDIMVIHSIIDTLFRGEKNK
jgi:hypothetical protein